ncbi:TPA: hypothetical protein SMI02_000602 [Serratia marcescens]|nr:hypothetical protein [Serratia marcescens]
MTLTTEQYTEGLCGDGAAILCDGVPMSVSEILGALNAANREVQPVALVDRRPAASGSICWQNGGKDLPHGTELFTASPAPAMVGELLEAMEEVIRISDRDHDAWNRVKVAITAYRAAVLAQPVSGGYKLVPVEPTENMIIHGFESDAFMALADAVNEKKGWPYGCRESAECVEGIFKAMLAAAPTQGKNNE